MRKVIYCGVFLSGVAFFLSLQWYKKIAAAPPTIFVSVASYRDVECHATIQDLFQQAAAPHNIYVGVTEQNKTLAEGCVDSESPWKKQIRKKYLHYTEAKGPTLARYWCSTLYRGETYFLQIDSHMRFEKNWDAQLIRMMTNLKKSYEKPVITHYPLSVEDIAARDLHVPVICKAKFNTQEIPTLEATVKPIHSNEFYPSPFVAGGFLFAEGRVITEVPYDPNLPFLFEGEEILYAARLYTHGYDFFAPDQNIMYHHYIREDSPKFWKDNPGYHHDQVGTLQKVRYLLGISNTLPPKKLMQDFHYSLGTKRTLAQYAAYAGVDFQQHTADKNPIFCRE